MEGKPEQPATGYRFKLDLGGHEEAALFDEATANVEGETVDLTQLRRIPSLHKVGDITLKRGVDTNKELWNWHNQASDADSDTARKSGSIMLLDYEGTPVVTYTIINAWPTKYHAPSLDAGGNEVAVEEIVIVHEGLELL